MTNQTIDTAYCYIDDAVGSADWKNTYDSPDAAVYADPDCKSKRLYQACFSKQLKTSFAAYKEWLKQFCISEEGLVNFKYFITYWMLDMFISQDNFCKVISLAVSDLKNGRKSYIEKEGTEPYFPGLEQFSKCVSNRKLKRVLSEMDTGEKKCIKSAFTSYIENMNLLIARRNQMIESIF